MVRPVQRLWICAPPADRVSSGVGPYTREGPGGVVGSYLGEMKIRFTIDDYTISWQRVEKGIVTGCTISPILFVMCMGMVTTAAERETRGPNIDSGIYQPQISGFMDDLTVTTISHIQALKMGPISTGR